MSFFWPTRLNPAAGFSAAFGRLIHWASLAFALLLVWAMAHLGGDFTSAGLKAGLWPAAAIALLGRGARYLFAGE